MYVVLNKHFQPLLAIILLLLTLAVSADGLPPLTHGLTPLKTPISAPSLQLQNMDEEQVNLDDLKGKVVIVNFWATWCPPCRREMGSLERLHLATANNNVHVLAVNVGEDIDTVFSFLGSVEPSPSFPILFDSDAGSMAPWKVRGLPTTYVIDPDGIIRYRAIGGREFDHPQLIKKILDLQR